MHRRIFLKSTAAAMLSAPFALRAVPPKRRPLKKGYILAALRGEDVQRLTLEEKFRLLASSGFDGLEVMSAMNVREVLAARDATGFPIHSLVIATGWSRPLTDPDPHVRQAGLEGLQQGLREAHAYGASTVLLVPGVVTKNVSYAEALVRCAEGVKKALPLAESLGVIIALENVWNNFLLSPLEAARFVDGFGSPMVRWYFDVGNVVTTGWPEHWIRTLGSRITKVHVKEYSRTLRDQKGPNAGFQVDLLQGDCDWPTVMKAFDGIGYSGWITAEQYRPPGLETGAWLQQLAGKLDAILAS